MYFLLVYATIKSLGSRNIKTEKGIAYHERKSNNIFFLILKDWNVERLTPFVSLCGTSGVQELAHKECLKMYLLGCTTKSTF